MLAPFSMVVRMASYSVATHVGSGMVHHRLEGDELVIEFEKTGKKEVVALADLTRVRLLQEMHGVHSVELTRQHASKLRITARHFLGVGRFESRASQYTAFVKALLAAAQQHAPDARFLTGSTVLFFLGWLCMVVSGFFVLAFAYALLFVDKPFPRQVLYLTPLTLALGVGLIRQGGTTSFDPATPPEKFLPVEAR